jgi:hypothetical protein
MERLIVRNRDSLLNIIRKSAVNADLNHLDVSGITDMSNIFEDSDFNGDISQWDVSNVRRMTGMFSGSRFNGDISNIACLMEISLTGMFLAFLLWKVCSLVAVSTGILVAGMLVMS